MSKEEFRALQRHWYDKLAERGFNDIEKIHGDDCVLKRPDTTAYLVQFRDEFTRQMDEEYFRRLAHAVHDEDAVYRNEVDRYIMVRHSDGAKIVTILYELQAQGISRDRKAVRVVIRKYEMTWGIRKYNRKQLDLKALK